MRLSAVFSRVPLRTGVGSVVMYAPRESAIQLASGVTFADHFLAPESGHVYSSDCSFNNHANPYGRSNSPRCAENGIGLMDSALALKKASSPFRFDAPR